jgi:DNA-binding protein HU-beta
MNKNELIEQIAGKIGMTKTAAAEVLEVVLDSISTTLEKGEEVRLVGFGSFRVSTRKASEGRNPRTGEAIQIGEAHNIKFRQGTELRERINSSRKQA